MAAAYFTLRHHNAARVKLRVRRRRLVLALGEEKIPPQLHFVEPNPHIEWDRMAVASGIRAGTAFQADFVVFWVGHFHLLNDILWVFCWPAPYQGQGV